MITRETARRAGIADGRNPANHQIFVENPQHQPDFLKKVSRDFNSRQSKLLDRRSKALGEIEREAQASSLTLIKRVNDLRAISDEINFSRLALERSSIEHRTESYGEVRFITPEEAGRERAERRLREIDREIEARVIKLSVATNTWLETWNYYLEQAKQALEHANMLADCYVEGLLSSHEYAAAIQRRWRRQSFELFPDWFADPEPQLQQAIPRGVRDSALQSWDKWLELWRQDRLPLSIERGYDDEFKR